MHRNGAYDDNSALLAGTIEILSSMKVISKGEKVPASAAALLGKLAIKPFAYGIEITRVLFLELSVLVGCCQFWLLRQVPETFLLFVCIGPLGCVLLMSKAK